MKILFVSHEASRSGAPLVLLNFMRWLREQTAIDFGVILRDGGSLQPDFAAVGEAMTYEAGRVFQTPRLASLAERAGVQGIVARLHHTWLKRRIAARGYTLIYSNTCANSDVLQSLSPLRLPIVCHVHELEIAIRYYGGTACLKSIGGRMPHFIAASEAARQNLISRHGIAADAIDVVHSFIRVGDRGADRDMLARVELRGRLGIPSAAFVVGACGPLNWWKGPDLFVQLARTVAQSGLGTPVHFVWIGGETRGIAYDQVWHDVTNAGLSELVHFVEPTKDPLEYFSILDVFALTSREESLSLVLLEAAVCRKAVVCFEGAGGPPEFVEEDCGFAVPYLDIHAMAEKICLLLSSPGLREDMGRRGRAKVEERHDISVAAPKILRVLEKVSRMN